MNQWWIFLVLCLGSLSSLCRADASLFSYQFQVFEDKQATLDIESIRSNPDHFAAQATSARNFGFTRSHFWLKLTTEQNTAGLHPLVIANDAPLLEHVQIFSKDGKKLVELGTKGSLRSLPFGQSMRAWPVPQSMEDQTFYVLIKSQTTVQIKLKVMEQSAYFSQEQFVNALKLLYCGALLSLSLYNFFLAIALRANSYFYYVATVLSFLMFQFAQNGNLAWLYPEKASFLSLILIPLFASVFYFFGLVFSYHFLSVQKALKPIRALVWCATIGAMVLSISSFFAPYRVLMPLIVLFSFVQVLILVIVSLDAVRRRVSESRFFLIAWSFYFLGLLTIGLRNFALLPSTTLIDYSLQIGSACEAFFLSFALAHRIRTTEQEKSRLESDNLVYEHSLLRERVVSQTMQMIAHDLRAPLHIFERLISIEVQDLDQHRPLIRQALARTSLMINSLRKGEIEEKVVLREQALDFSLAESILKEKASSLGKKLSFVNQASSSILVSIDLPKVERALINLVINALEACQNEVQICIYENEANVNLEVKDDGPGVPEEIRSRLFVRGTTYGKFHGTGLGLSYTKRIADAHGGDLLYQRSGLYTLFTLVLPYQKIGETYLSGTLVDEEKQPEHPSIVQVGLFFEKASVNQALLDFLKAHFGEGITFIDGRMDLSTLVVTDQEQILEEASHQKKRVFFFEPDTELDELRRRVPLRLGKMVIQSDSAPKPS